jgi:hypothetical protein
MIKPYLSLNEKWLFKGGRMQDEMNMGVDLDKIKKAYWRVNIYSPEVMDSDYLNKNDILYVVSKGKGQFIFIYSLKDKHYFFRNIKYSTITGKFLHPGWNTDVPISVNSTETPPHQYIERGYSISSMNGGKGWGAKSSQNTIFELPITLSSRFINWQLSNPMDVKL